MASKKQVERAKNDEGIVTLHATDPLELSATRTEAAEAARVLMHDGARELGRLIAKSARERRLGYGLFEIVIGALIMAFLVLLSARSLMR